MKKIKKPNQPEREIKIALGYADSIIATLREPFLILNKNLRIVSANRSFYTTFKVTKKETVGQLLPNLGNRQWDIPDLLHFLKKILPQKRIVENYEVEHKFKTIGHRIMNLNACQLRIPKKITRAITGGREEEEEEEEEEELSLLAIEDITELRQAKAEIINARDYAESIIYTIRESLLVLDGKLRVVSASRVFYETFKTTPRETEGELVYNLGNRQWNIPKLRQLLDKIIPNHASFDNFEVEYKFPKIGQRTMLLNARRIPPPPAQPERILLAIEDITEIKLMQQARVETAKAEAREKKLKTDLERQKKIDKIKTEFISMASHQLKTPLTAISWFVEMLRRREVGELKGKQKEYLDDIYQSNRRMIELVNNLLNVSQMETGVLKIEPKLIQFEKIIEDIIDELESKTNNHKCRIVFKKPKKKLPKILIDSTLMRQVVRNLIINAVYYSLLEQCDVLVKLEQKNDNYIFSVEDKGIGIPKNKQHRIFEKFFRTDEAQKIKPEGSGLGLCISKMIIKGSGGKIWFESEENKGTKFYVSIPLEGMKQKKGKKKLAGEKIS